MCVVMFAIDRYRARVREGEKDSKKRRRGALEKIPELRIEKKQRDTNIREWQCRNWTTNRGEGAGKTDCSEVRWP